MGDHPTPAALEDFAWDRISSRRARAVLSHLTGGCDQCLAAVARHLMGQLGWGEPPEPVLTPQVGVPREARASLLLLRKAFEMQKADAAILDYVINLLRKGENAARGRLEPPVEE